MRTGSKKLKYDTLVVTGLMKIGRSPRGNFHIKNTRSKKKKSIGKPDKVTTKKEQPPPEKKMDFKPMLNWFMETSKTQNNANDVTFRNHQASTNTLRLKSGT